MAFTTGLTPQPDVAAPIATPTITPPTFPTTSPDVVKSSSIFDPFTGAGQQGRLDTLQTQQNNLAGTSDSLLSRFNDLSAPTPEAKSTLAGLQSNFQGTAQPQSDFLQAGNANINQFEQAALQDLQATQAGVETVRLKNAKTAALSILAPLGLADDTVAQKAVATGLGNVTKEIEGLFAPLRTQVRQNAATARDQLAAQDLAFRMQFLSDLETTQFRSQANLVNLIANLTGQQTNLAKTLGQAATPGEQSLASILGIIGTGAQVYNLIKGASVPAGAATGVNGGTPVSKAGVGLKALQATALEATPYIPGQYDEKAVAWLANGGIKNLAKQPLDKIAAVGDRISSWFGGGSPLVDAAGNLTSVGTQAVDSLMQTGVAADDAITAVASSDAGFFGGTAGTPTTIGGGLASPSGASSGASTTGAGGIGSKAGTSSSLANAGAGFVGGVAGQLAASQFTKHFAISKTGDLTRGGTTAAGATYGATVGSAFGPIGTAVGAFVGAVVGWFAGSALGRGLFGDGNKHGMTHSGQRAIDSLHKYIPDMPVGEAAFQKWLLDKSGGKYDTGKNLEDSNNAMVDQIGMTTISMMEDPVMRLKAAEDFFRTGGNSHFDNAAKAFKFAMVTDPKFYRAIIAKADPSASGNKDRNVLASGGLYAGDKPGTVIYDKFKELNTKYGIRNSDTGDFAHDGGVLVKQLNTMGINFSSNSGRTS